MTKQPKKTLKGYFESGRRPNQGQFHNLIDSSLNLLETDLQTVSSAVSASSFKSDSHITASGDISASGDIKSRNIALDGDITSSGHLSGSSNKDITGFRTASVDRITTTNISASGDIIISEITASKGISSSGDLEVADVRSSGNISAETDITASGNIKATKFVGDGSELVGVTSTVVNTVTASMSTGSLLISGSSHYTSGSTEVLLGIKSSGSIIPHDDKKFDLGSPSLNFREIYTEKIIFSSNIIPDSDNTRDIGTDEAQIRETHTTTASLARIDAKFSDNLINVSGSLIPILAGNFSIGTSDKSWGDAFFSGVATLGTLTGIVNFPVNISASLVPVVDNTYDLGNANAYFKSFFTSTASLGVLESKESDNEIIVSSSFIPHAHAVYDLGKPGTVSTNGDFTDSGTDGTARQWRNLYVYGTASVDVLRAEQEIALFITASAIAPQSTQIDVDLGYRGGDITQNSYSFKNLFLDETAHIATLANQGNPSGSAIRANIIQVSGNLVPRDPSGTPYVQSWQLGAAGHNVGLNPDHHYNSEVAQARGFGKYDPKLENMGPSLWESVHASFGNFTKIGAWGSRSDRFGLMDIETEVMYVSCSFVPLTGGGAILDNEFFIGHEDNAFRELHSHKAFHRTIHSNQTDQEIGVNAHLVPEGDGNYDLGTSGEEWRNIYSTGFVSVDKIKNFQSGEFNIDSNVSPTADDFYYFGRTNETIDEDGVLQTDIYRWRYMAAVTQSAVLITGHSASIDMFGFSPPTGGGTYAPGQYYDDDPTVVNFNGKHPIVFNSGSFLPHTHNAMDLGRSHHHWRHLYVAGFLVSGGIFYPVDSTGSVSEGGSFTYNGDLLPNGDNIYNIGSDSNQWKVLHASTHSVSHIHSKYQNPSYLIDRSTGDFLNEIWVSGSLCPHDNLNFSLGFRGDDAAINDYIWKKLVVHQITASNNISSSGLLYTSASLPTHTSDIVALVYDKGTGEVHYTGSYVSEVGGGGGTVDPAGSNQQVQFNNSNNFGADSAFFYNSSTDTLAAPTITASSGIITNDLTASGNVSASGNGSFTGTLQVDGAVDFNGNLDVDGTTNLDNTDIDGTLNVDGDVTLGSACNDDINILGTITASCDISTSANVITTNITASNDVSASGNVYSQHVTSSVLNTSMGDGGSGSINFYYDSSPTLTIANFKDMPTQTNISEIPVGTLFVYTAGTSLLLGQARYVAIKVEG